MTRCERRPRSLAVAALVLLTGGCTALDDALAAVPVFAFMRQSPAFDPYEAPRPAPPGAVPYSSPAGRPEPAVLPTQASLLAFAASPYGINPLDPGDPAVLELGRTMYDRHCMVCHGAQGEGNGPIVGPDRFPLGPVLNAGAAAGLSDGYLYAVIRAGRTLMPPYGARTTVDERWAIVSYLRQLQGGTPGTQAPAGAQPVRE